MSISELINEIVSDWAYRVNDGMPNPNNPNHVKQLEVVLSEMGLGHVKSEILQGLMEAEEGGFTNPALNKKVRYKNANGEDKEGIVGNLLRQPEDSPGRKAAEAALPPEGSPERDAMNQELGSEKDGKAKAPEDEKGKEGEDGKGGGESEEEKKKKAAAMFDPKADPAMGARLDREKAASEKLAQKDKEDSAKEKDSVQAQDDKLVNFINKDFDESPDKDFEGMSDADVQSKELEARWKNADAIKEKGEDSPEAKATKAEWAKHMVEKSKRRGDMENAAMWDSIRQDNDPTYKPKKPTAKGGPGSGRRPSGNTTNTPDEQPTGPAGGPNAEPPMDEPSKPDTTPPIDGDVPDVNSPNDTEVPIGQKIENNKVDIQNAQNRLKELERMKKDHPEQFSTPEKKKEYQKNKEILASKKQELADLESQQKFDAEKKKKEVEPIANELKNRKTTDGEDLDVETTDNGSMIIGVEHGANNESTKQTISQIQKLPKDAKVMFVGEGGMGKDNDGNIEFGEEQDEIRNAVKGHFDNSEESSWDENANVYDDNSPVYKEIEKELGSPSKSRAAIWSNMVGQGDDNMNPDDYLDDEGKQWIIDQAKKAGATNITDKTDFSNLTDAEKKDLYELNYNDEGKMGDNEIMKGQEAYNGFRQKELDRKIKEAEDKGYTVVAPVGNSHVDMWRQRNKPQQKPEQPTDAKPEETPKQEPSSKPKTPPKATKDDIKNEKPGKEAKTDNGGSLYSVGGGYYSDKPNGPAKYVRTESVFEMAFEDSLNEDVFALFEKSITGTLQNGEKITVQELPPRAVKKATQRARAAAASSTEGPAQQTAKSAEKPAETPKAQPKSGDFNPINADDVQKEIPNANPETFGSEPDIPSGIEPKDLQQFNTDIDKVAKEISDAKERGEKAPNINLCDVTVPGTNLYCDDNLGIPRAEMPQFKGKPQPGTPAADMPADKNGEVDTEPLFKKMLEDKGIKVVQTEVPSDKLKATQSELVGDKVIGMMNALENDPNHPNITAPIYVSRDGYVIDGHHRWAAITAYNAKHPDNQIPMKVQAIDMDIKEAIPMCNDFAEQQGVAAKKADANQESDIQNVTSLPEPKPEDPEEKKSWYQKQKERIKQKLKVMSIAGKEFFDRGGHKPGSAPRRSLGQALLDKAKGAPKAIGEAIKHHLVMFKDAGVAIFEAGVYGGFGTVEDPDTKERFNHDDHIARDENGKKRYEKIPQYETDSHGHIINDPQTGKPMQKRHWLTGNLMYEDRPIPKEDMSDKQKELFYKSYQKEKKQIKAIVGTGKAILITAAGAYGLSAVMGHAYTTVGQLATSTAIELVPHTIAEGVILGTGKAAIFAGAVEMNHRAKLDEFGTKLMSEIGKYLSGDKEIPADVLANTMELYNNMDKIKENMDKVPEDEAFLKDYVQLMDSMGDENNKQKSEMTIESVINEIISEIQLMEAEQFKARAKDSGKVVVFKSREAMDAAVKDGSHEPIDSKQTKTDEPVKGASMFGADYQKDRGDTVDLPHTRLNLKPGIHAKGGPGSGRKPDKPKKKKKNKELNQKINTKKVFNDGYFAQDGVADKDFKKNPKVKPTPKQLDIKQLIPFLVDKNGNTGFPKKYIKVLNRLLNTKTGNGLTISDFTDASGAGTLSSTMGELLTLMSATIKDEAKANEFFDMISAHVKANGKESIIDVGWVKSAQKVRQTLFKRFDRVYGKGNWQLEQMGWDTEKEVEAMGLENYKENKGFSTDVYAKVKVNGKSVLDEVSLKKELTANLLNGTSNRIQDIMVRGAASDEDLKIYEDLNTKIEALMGLTDKASKDEKKKLSAQRDAMIEKYNAKVPDEAKVAYAQQKQRELHQDFIKSGDKEVKEFLGKFCSKNTKYRTNAATIIKNQLNQKDDYINQVTKKIDGICKEVRSGKSYAEALLGLEKSDYQKLNLGIMSLISVENPKSKAAKSYKSIVENSHNHSKAVREFLLKDPNARKGLFASIREAFPLKALFEGEENMILGDVSADKQVLSDVFGVASFEELEQKLTIRDVPPPPSIVYRVVGKEDIPVAEISSRPDGIGYGGTWKLEMKVHPEFGKKLKESNTRLNS